MNFSIKHILPYSLFCIIGFSSCRKLVQIDPPANSITTAETFADSSDLVSAMSGAYYTLSSSAATNILNGGMTVYTGMSADELAAYSYSSDARMLYDNSMVSNNAVVYANFWTPAYKIAYQLNAIINGIASSTTLSAPIKSQFTGEAKFLRALCYFYMVNLFGDVPYITTIDYTVSNVASRTPQSQVYQNIIADLQAAVTSLPSDYSATGGDRIRANKWAAVALLARVYLYTKDYTDAATLSASLINNTSLFALNPNLNQVFYSALKGNNEAILQWEPMPSQNPYNATSEGFNIIPASNKVPKYYMSTQLLNAFESGDQRKVNWVNSTVYSGKTYYYPYKYKIGISQATINGTLTEYETVLRLGEQYLIHAEALAQQGTNLTDAINDLNAIRERAGLPDLSSSLTQAQVLSAITQERRIELFAEWGHRWLDLKRAGQVDSVMTIATPLKNAGTVWKSYQQLYPIPNLERKANPNLSQNTDY